MRSGRLLIVAGAALLLSGCARQARSQLARLQSQVGLLDERITQLERMGTSSASSISSGDAAGAWSGTTASSSGGSGSSIVVRGPSESSKATKTASSKPSTKEIQQALKEAGFYQGKVDGKLGPLTRQAIEEFQRVNGLTPDGVVGKQTWTKLKQYAELSSGESSSTAYIK